MSLPNPLQAISLMSKSGRVSVCLLVAGLLLGGCGAESESPYGELSRSAPVMVWGGASILGYLRVELFAGSTRKQPAVQELVVCNANGAVSSYRGFMINLPDDLPSTPGAWRAFVRTPDDFKANHFAPAMIAVVSPVGVLRLYEFTGRQSSMAPDLLPLN